MEIEEIIIYELINGRVRTSADLSLIKRRISKKYKIPFFSNIELLKAYHKLKEKKIIKANRGLEELLRIRKIRSLSGFQPGIGFE